MLCQHSKLRGLFKLGFFLSCLIDKCPSNVTGQLRMKEEGGSGIKSSNQGIRNGDLQRTWLLLLDHQLSQPRDANSVRQLSSYSTNYDALGAGSKNGKVVKTRLFSECHFSDRPIWVNSFPTAHNRLRVPIAAAGSQSKA